MTVEFVSKFSRGRRPRKHFEAAPAATHLGAHLAADNFPDVFGSWDMLDAVGGIGDQAATSRCLAYATKKLFGLFQYGQSGTPVEFSADWIYALVLSEIRRMELGGGPVANAAGEFDPGEVEAWMKLLEANPLTDTGSEPSAADAACKRIGIATEAAWPTGAGFRSTELDLGGAIVAQPWKVEAGGFTSIIAVPGPAMTQALLAAGQPFAKSGKRGQAVRGSVGSSTAGFDGADGTRPLLAADFNQNYDHEVVPMLGAMRASVYEQVLGRQLTAAEKADSPLGWWFVLANSWNKEQWGQFTKLPELVGGKPTGNVIPFPGCVVTSEAAQSGMADQDVVAEVAA